jgi:16S rRNA processing protein RimM
MLDDRRKLTVTSTRTDRGHLLVCFEGVADREGARELTGRFVHVTVADLPALPEGSWWPHQIEGCEVSLDDGRELGVVGEVIANPANDIWAVATPDGREILVPVLKDLLVSVDVEAHRIVIREMPGLLE